MRVSPSMVGALMLGAGAMYLFDADRGPRRRALLRDRGSHVLRRAGEAAGKKARHLRNRARGVVAEARVRSGHGEPVGDEVLVERVRAALGRVVGDASAIEVTASDGQVRLSGSVSGSQLDTLLRTVERVPGVEEVYDELETGESWNGLPRSNGWARNLASEGRRSGMAPALRLLAGVAGGVATMKGLRRRGPLGTMLGMFGATMLRKAMTGGRA